MIHLIAAVAKNGVIGFNGQIPWRLPEDLRHFQALTMGHTVIMGRRTYESIGRPLPGRQNVVVSSTLTDLEGCAVARSLQEALALADRQEIFIIGGARLYREALPLAEQLDLTLLDLEPTGDTWFPQVDWSQFAEVCRERRQDVFAYEYRTYRRVTWCDGRSDEKNREKSHQIVDFK